jgi:hypothetical protein
MIERTYEAGTISNLVDGIHQRECKEADLIEFHTDVLCRVVLIAVSLVYERFIVTFQIDCRVQNTLGLKPQTFD